MEHKEIGSMYRVRHLISLFILLIIAVVIVAGCASRKASEDSREAVNESEAPRLITEITMEDDGRSYHLLIKGNRLLTYTSVKQPFPLAIILYFSDTGLNIGNQEGSVPVGVEKTYELTASENDIISLVKASELSEAKTPQKTTSRIEIALKKDIPYEVIREDAVLRISFEKPEGLEKAAVPERTVEEYDLVQGGQGDLALPGVQGSLETPASQHTATRVQTVYATKLQESLKVFIGADGMITNYKSFTIDSPASIVFDIFDVRSPYENEKVIQVNTQWVRQVRYYGYPDRLRVILDTEKSYLSAYSAYPVDNGLLIHVGSNGSALAGYGTQGSSQRLEPTIGQRLEPTESPQVGSQVGSSLRLEPTPAEYQDKGTMYSPSASSQRLEATEYSGSAADAPVRQLQAVYATQFRNGIIVTVRGDGMMKYYESSTIAQPPTIIFDIFNLKSNDALTRLFPVDTQWVKSIRHESHPDRLRLFIETRTSYLSAYWAYPDRNGLVIYVGASPSGLTVARTGEGSGLRPKPIQGQPGLTTGEAGSTSQRLEPTREGEAAEDGTRVAWVSQLNFVAKEAGKSELVIRTTRPVRYDIQDVADPLTGMMTGKNLELRMSETQLPKHRQGHLIEAESFESAVEQITPETIPGDISVFSVRLREAVPYYVEKTDNNSIILHFEASSISPKAAKSKPSEIEITNAKEPDKAIREPESPREFSRPLPEIGQRAERPLLVIPPKMDETPSPESEVKDFLEPEKRYTGEKIALDFFETDIKNVFRILKQVSGKNFAIDNDVKGKVTLSLEQPVPWDQVLDLVLKMNQLGRIFEGDIIRVATLSTIQKEDKLRQEKMLQMQTMKDQKKALEPVRTEYIPINYSNAASEIQPHLEKIITKDRGSLSVDQRTNIVIMTDTDEKLRRAKEIVEKLDRVTPQVLIEAKIIEANSNFSKQIGVSWGAGGGISSGSPNAGVGPQRGYDVLGGTYGYDMAVNLPPSDYTSNIGFNFSRIIGSPLLLNAQLLAMESQGGGKIISTPQILTLDNKAAKISQGYEYPYRTIEVSGGVATTTTAFKNIDLNLDVTPHITPDNRISMKININKNDLFSTTDEGPALTKKSATTELLVNDGDTIVIGGITQSSETLSKDYVPGLSKIPLLGWLFRSDTESLTRVELLIFITPRIVQLEQRRTQY